MNSDIIAWLTVAILTLGAIVKHGWPFVRSVVRLAEAKPTLEAIANQFRGGNGGTLREVVEQILELGQARDERLGGVEVRLTNLEQQVESLLTDQRPVRRKPDPDPGVTSQ